MKPPLSVKHEFVDVIPDALAEGVVYVSIPFTVAVHKCFCGCGEEVVTPISPTDWTLLFNGKTISLDPSIGNWGFKCQSHYWIRGDKVYWATKWSQEEIEANRADDRIRKKLYFEQGTDLAGDNDPGVAMDSPEAARFWAKVTKWFS